MISSVGWVSVTQQLIGMVLDFGDNVLYPAVCLEVPSRGGTTGNNKDLIFPAVNVMFPHLQELGLPASRNRFSRAGLTSAEACVPWEGFDSLQHYFNHFDRLE